MRILICSDSHGVTRTMIAAAVTHSPDMLLFLGDGLRDFEALRRRFPGLPAEAVRGNCDLLSREPEQRLLELGGVRIFLAHGHRFGVKRDLSLMIREALRCDAKLMLFGHTHRALYHEEEGLALFNPGSAGAELHPACGLLELCGGKASFRHINEF